MKRLLNLFILITFCFSNLSSYPVFAANVPYLPPTGQMIVTSSEFTPVILKGVTVNPDNPFQLSFLLDEGDTNLTKVQLEQETNILIRYFLAALTTPEQDLWVNLSPYENNRIIPQALGITDLGRDLLAQDYILKQLSASLTYPESAIGKEYWNEMNGAVPAGRQVGANNHSSATQSFNKVWIVPDKTKILESGLTAYIKESSMKVMMEEDYLAAQKNNDRVGTALASAPNNRAQASSAPTNAFKTHILPLIEADVNQGKNFAYLRQIHNAIVLAAWFKKRLKDTIYNQLYIDKKKIAGIDTNDPNAVNQIYNQYVDAFKQGVYNYVKRVPYGDNLAATSRGALCAGVRSSRIAYFSGGYADAGMGAGMQADPTPKPDIVSTAVAEIKSPTVATTDLLAAGQGAMVTGQPRLSTVANLATPEDPARDKSTGAIGRKALVVSTVAVGVIAAFVAGVHQRHKADLTEEAVDDTLAPIVGPKNDAGVTPDTAKSVTDSGTKVDSDKSAAGDQTEPVPVKKTKADFVGEIKKAQGMGDIRGSVLRLIEIASEQKEAGFVQDARMTFAYAIKAANMVEDVERKIQLRLDISSGQAALHFYTDAINTIDQTNDYIGEVNIAMDGLLKKAAEDAYQADLKDLREGKVVKIYQRENDHRLPRGAVKHGDAWITRVPSPGIKRSDMRPIKVPRVRVRLPDGSYANDLFLHHWIKLSPPEVPSVRYSFFAMRDKVVEAWTKVAAAQAADGLVKEAKATLAHARIKVKGIRDKGAVEKDQLSVKISIARAKIDAADDTQRVNLAAAYAVWHGSLKSLFVEYGIFLTEYQYIRLWNEVHLKSNGWRLAPKGFKANEEVVEQQVYAEDGKFDGIETVKVIRGPDKKLRIRNNSAGFIKREFDQVFNIIGTYNDSVDKGVRAAFDGGWFGEERKGLTRRQVLFGTAAAAAAASPIACAVTSAAKHIAPANKMSTASSPQGALRDEARADFKNIIVRVLQGPSDDWGFASTGHVDRIRSKRLTICLIAQIRSGFYDDAIETASGIYDKGFFSIVNIADAAIEIAQAYVKDKRLDDAKRTLATAVTVIKKIQENFAVHVRGYVQAGYSEYPAKLDEKYIMFYLPRVVHCLTELAKAQSQAQLPQDAASTFAMAVEDAKWFRDDKEEAAALREIGKAKAQAQAGLYTYSFKFVDSVLASIMDIPVEIRNKESTEIADKAKALAQAGSYADAIDMVNTILPDNHKINVLMAIAEIQIRAKQPHAAAYTLALAAKIANTFYSGGYDYIKHNEEESVYPIYDSAIYELQQLVNIAFLKTQAVALDNAAWLDQDAALVSDRADWQKSLESYMAEKHPDITLTSADKEVLWKVHLMPGGWRPLRMYADEEIVDDNGVTERVLSNGKTVRVKFVPGKSVDIDDTVVVHDMDGTYRLSTVRLMYNNEKGVTRGTSKQNADKKSAAITGGIDEALYDDLALVGLEGEKSTGDAPKPAAGDVASDNERKLADLLEQLRTLGPEPDPMLKDGYQLIDSDELADADRGNPSNGHWSMEGENPHAIGTGWVWVVTEHKKKSVAIERPNPAHAAYILKRNDIDKQIGLLQSLGVKAKDEVSKPRSHVARYALFTAITILLSGALAGAYYLGHRSHPQRDTPAQQDEGLSGLIELFSKFFPNDSSYRPPFPFQSEASGRYHGLSFFVGKHQIRTNRRVLEEHLADFREVLPEGELTVERIQRFIDGHETLHTLLRELKLFGLPANFIDRKTEERLANVIGAAFADGHVAIPDDLRHLIGPIEAALNRKLANAGKAQISDLQEFIEDIRQYDNKDPKSLEAILKGIGIDVEVKDATPQELAAMAPMERNGGIDDREGLMRMQIQSDGSKIPVFKNMPVDIQNFAGFSFKIVSITRSK